MESSVQQVSIGELSVMKVQEIMSRNVETVEPSTLTAKAAEKMRDLRIGFLVVLENDRLEGVLTDRDITIRSVAEGRDPRASRVGDIMTPTVFYCYEEDDVERVGEQMREQEVRRMVILDQEDKLVGVVSLGDIAKTIGETDLAGETLGDIAEAA
jgi:CBS domain-containing protein